MKKYTLETYALIISVLSAILSGWSAYTSHEALTVSQELKDKTLPTLSPVEPRLKIELIKDGDGLIFSKYDLSRILRDSKNEPYSRAQVAFKVTNIGQMDSGPINFKLLGNWTEKDKFDDYVYEENIEKWNFTYVRFNLWDERCTMPYSNCSIQDIPNGTQKLTLDVSCGGCNPGLEKKEFEICVGDKKSECL